MRKEWFEFVRKIRAKEERRNKKKCSHKEAMAIASPLWAKEKARLIRKRQRIKKREDKSKKQEVLEETS